MKIFPIILLASLTTSTSLLNAEDDAETVDFGLDTPAKSKEFLPDHSELGLSQPTFENSQTSTQKDFDFSTTESSASSEDQQYQRTVAVIEEERKAAKHREDVATQSQAFSREFLSMNLYGKDFPQRFAELLEKYPLAAEEEFCGRLITKGRRVLAAKEAVVASSKEEAGTAIEPAPQAETEP